jgi:hypothetical protein
MNADGIYVCGILFVELLAAAALRYVVVLDIMAPGNS